MDINEAVVIVAVAVVLVAVVTKVQSRQVTAMEEASDKAQSVEAGGFNWAFVGFCVLGVVSTVFEMLDMNIFLGVLILGVGLIVATRFLAVQKVATKKCD